MDIYISCDDDGGVVKTVHNIIPNSLQYNQ